MERNLNIAKTDQEKEEDLLEYIYRQDRQNRYLTASEYAIEGDLYAKEAARLVRNLVKKGYLKESSKKGVIVLTENGYLKGIDCLARHEKLTQFFQMISGMTQEKAQEDACRLEHYISSEALEGIDHFLQFGDVYDRTYEGMDLYTQYGEGSFEMKMGLYELEQRNPRKLAKSFSQWYPKAILKVEKDRNYFIIKTKDDRSEKIVRYRQSGKWTEAMRTDEGYCLPADIFTYMVSTAVPITEAKTVIAATSSKRGQEEPDAEDCCEINIHIW